MNDIDNRILIKSAELEIEINDLKSHNSDSEIQNKIDRTNARLSYSNGIHLTLKFLGEVDEEKISIINQDKKQLNNNTEFYSILPSSITFISKEFIMDHNKSIPTEFELKFSDPKSYNKTSIQAKISMKTYDIHHTRILIFNTVCCPYNCLGQ